MSLVTLKFFIFVAMTVVTYYFCMPKLRWIVILAANIGFFIAGSSVALFAVFAAMTLAAWAAALAIKTLKSETIQSAITTVTVLGLVVTLILYKEISFFIRNLKLLESFTGLSFNVTFPDWTAPLGISYFTLILVGYLLDVRWGTIPEAQKNPLKMLAFAGYFPHMTSGPFSNYKDIKDTLFGAVKFRASNIWRGFQRVVWGVFKLAIISTRLSILVETIYSAQKLPLSENRFTGLAVVCGAILYVLNVYMNFSGSMDVVIGVSEMFGIPLAENFQRPFSSTSLSEVWRKWHMTLGFWLKDHVLYPTLKSAWMNRVRVFCKTRFGKKAAKNIPTYIGMLITWLCVGFWHGGSWKYICGSGLFFFVMIAGGLILEPLFKRIIEVCRINTNCSLWRGFQRARTFLLFSLSVSFGRAGSLMGGFHMWRNAFRGLNLQVFFDGTILNMGLKKLDLMFTLMGLVAVFWVSHVQQQHGSMRDLLAKRNLLFRIGIIALLFSVTFLIGGWDNRIDLMYGNF